MYAALLDEDPALNRAALAADGRLAMSVTLVGGSLTIPKSVMEMAATEIAVDAEVEVIERVGHWIAEEQPDALTQSLVRLAERSV